LLEVVEVFTILELSQPAGVVVVLVDHMLVVVMVNLLLPLDMEEKTAEVVVDPLTIQ
tara:strand:+ start:243 stop:413 length:171 start_codon:yes stop_codon:yes gene_type:complete